MHILLVLPLVIPLATAIAVVLTARTPAAHRWLSLGGAAVLCGVTLSLLMTVMWHGIQAVQIGNWPAPFGITLVVDLLSAIMLVLAGVIGLAVALHGVVTPSEQEPPSYHALCQLLLMGVCGAFLAGDLFNLYVWFEVFLMASFALLIVKHERPQLEGAVKYFLLNFFASALFLTTLGLVYGLAGTLNMADLARILSGPEAARHPAVLHLLALFFLVAFGVKAAAFPFFFWLPASYHTTPVAVAALFSGLLTKVGVYALLRVFTLLFTQETELFHTLFLWIAALTMVTGVLGAVAQDEFRRLLSFHIVSQIGYALMGLGLFSPLALAGAIFFTFHVAVAKAALFLVSGVVAQLKGTFELKKLGGLYQTHPTVALSFLVPAFSLTGLPPLSGFFAKVSLLQAGVQEEHYLLVAVALGVSLLTLFSMLKIWNEVFWKPTPHDASLSMKSVGAGVRITTLSPTLFLSAVLLLLGFGAGPLFALALQAAEQLLDPAAYIRIVLQREP